MNGNEWLPGRWSPVLLLEVKFHLVFFLLTGDWEEDELGLSGERPQWGEQLLYCDRAHLALCGLPLQDLGVRGGSRAGVEGRAEGLRVQHSAARLRERMLRPPVPHLAGAPLGSAAHRSVHSIPAGRSARGLQGAPGGQTQAETVRGQREHRWRSVLHLRYQPGLQDHLRGGLPACFLLPVQRLRRAHTAPLQPEPLSQRGGLLHRQSQREEDLPLHHGLHLHPVHRSECCGAPVHCVEAAVETFHQEVRAQRAEGFQPQPAICFQCQHVCAG